MRRRVALIVMAGCVMLGTLPGVVDGGPVAAECPPASEPLWAEDMLNGPVELGACDLETRRIRSRTDSGLEVVIPTDGATDESILVYETHTSVLRATRAGMAVTVELSIGPDEDLDPPDVTISEPLGCTQTRFELFSGHWFTTMNWWYNVDTAVNRAGLTASTAVDAVRAGNANVTNLHNDCGHSGGSNAEGQYQGPTSRYANIREDATPSDSWPDGSSVVSHGHLLDAGLEGRIASMRNWYISGQTDESDILIDSDRWADGQKRVLAALSPDCNDVSKPQFDLQSLMTHEWGHAYGLADLHGDTARWLTMYQGLEPCKTYIRTLGEGDILGILAMYGGD